jgi:hypothetical protein
MMCDIKREFSNYGGPTKTKHGFGELVELGRKHWIALSKNADAQDAQKLAISPLWAKTPPLFGGDSEGAASYCFGCHFSPCRCFGGQAVA